MKAKTQFDSENFLMSVFGHLVLVAIIMFSVSVVIERAKLVTPNRIEIIEIDLKNVKISGEETKLYNTKNEDEKDTQKVEEKEPKKSENTKNTEIEKITINQPTMIENESKDSIKNEEKKDTKKPVENKPLPRKKTTIKVKREVLSLDRTMTISVIDALR
ncbi:MAG: hypothetical protein IKZ49_01305, partial [Alphaproteobacteria bacterium]|nr:hypothetical protein [Alphaproteobacteria bacterium]